MTTHLLVLPDGTEICSGAPGSAVMAVQLTREVNSQLLLSPGTVSAAMLQLSLLSPEVSVRAGDTLRLYRADTRQPVGIFIAQTPVITGQLQKITAYDRLILLDQEATPLLQTLSWPQTLYELAAEICKYCGLTLQNTELPMGEFSVGCPTGSCTGRQLLSWIAQAAGCFVQATADGQVEFGWYTPAPLEICPELPRCLGGVLRLSGRVTDGSITVGGGVEEGVLHLRQQYVLTNGLSLETGAVSPIDRVQLRQTDTDVGLIYPDAPGENTLVIQGNPLLAAEDANNLQPIAEHLYARFAGLTYTPGTLKLPVTPQLQPGQLLTVTDPDGQRHNFFIMGLQRTSAGDTLTCTGSFNRDSATVRNNRTYAELQGKMLQLRTDVDGIRAENSNNAGKLSALALDVEGIRGTVSRQEGITQRLTTLEQTADSLKLSVQSIQTDGATKLKTAMGYRFDDSGLSISRTGEPMENKLDNTGMQVLRSGTPILKADHQGVLARDVSVQNYLIVGSYARLENYGSGRTACFWLGG